MSAKKAAGKTKAVVSEAKVVALAEQLGWFLGTVQAKAEGWLDRERIRKDVARIRDGAAQLLQHVDAAARSARMESARPKPVAKPAAKAKAKPAAKAAAPRKQKGRKTLSVKSGGR